MQQREHVRAKMSARLSRAARDDTPKESSPTPSQIRATSQQSRFHLASIEADTTAIDLETVCIATGENEVIVDASLRIKEGVRYGLIGRNGCGKSSEYGVRSGQIVRAEQQHYCKLWPRGSYLGCRLIYECRWSHRSMLVLVTRPRIYRFFNTFSMAMLTGETPSASRLVRVQSTALTVAILTALGTEDSNETQRIINQLLVERAEQDLNAKRLRAARLSGARGWDARAEEIEAEQNLAKAFSR